jgi:AcrR family transcriptional regulator
VRRENADVPVEKWTPERRRERTRTALVDAARDVFARKGYEGASLDEIAAAAGYTRGAIYKHFDDKEDLLFAVYDAHNEWILRAFAAQLESGVSAVFDTAALAATWKQFMANDRDVLALGLEFQLYELRNPAVRERSVAQRQRNRQLVADFMREQAQATGIDFKIPYDTLAAILLITSDGFSTAAQLDPADADLYQSFLELVLPALVTPQ